MVGQYLVICKIYKNIIKEISLEAEKNKKEHFYYSSSKNFEKPIIFNSHIEIIEYLDNNPPILNSLIEEVFLQNLALNNYFKGSKVFFIFSQFDSVSLESQMKTLSLINNNNPHVQIIDPIKKISFIKELKIEKDFIKIKVSRKGDIL